MRDRQRSVGILNARGVVPLPSDATVWRVLVRRGSWCRSRRSDPGARGGASRPSAPNEIWQIDGTDWTSADGTDVKIINLIDDHSRYVPASHAAPGETCDAAWAAFSDAVAEIGMPSGCLSDNGLAFSGRLRGFEVDFETPLARGGRACYHLEALSPADVRQGRAVPTVKTARRAVNSRKNGRRALRPAEWYNSIGLARLPDPNRRRHRGRRHARRSSRSNSRTSSRRTRHYAAAGAHELDIAPFSVVTPVGEWTLARAGGTFTITSGVDGAAVVRLTEADVADVVNDLKTPMTFLTGGSLDMPRGNLGNFLDWWVVLRALIDERPVHARGAVDFRDRDGAPLDLHRSFGADDDDAEIAHFLAQAGFLHLRNWFDVDAMDEISGDMDAALPSYERGDGQSWWARTAAGDDRCVRMLSFDTHSPRTVELLDSERYLRIGRLTDDDYQPRRRATASRGSSSRSASSKASPMCRGTRTVRSGCTPTGVAASPPASPSPAPTRVRANCASSRARTAPWCNPRSCAPVPTSRHRPPDGGR